MGLYIFESELRVYKVVDLTLVEQYLNNKISFPLFS